MEALQICFFFFSSRRRHTRCYRDWSSDVCSSDLQARAAGDRGARTGRAGQRPGHPGVLLLGRQPAFELPDVPRPRDVEREAATAEPGALEIAPASALAQEGFVLLQGEGEEGLELVEGQEDRVAMGTPVLPEG